MLFIFSPSLIINYLIHLLKLKGTYHLHMYLMNCFMIKWILCILEVTDLLKVIFYVSGIKIKFMRFFKIFGYWACTGDWWDPTFDRTSGCAFPSARCRREKSFEDNTLSDQLVFRQKLGFLEKQSCHQSSGIFGATDH